MIRWTYAFLDRPRDTFDASAAFWTTVTATELSPRRGENHEFATLLPAGGHAAIKIQGTGGTPGGHLDLVVTDVDRQIATATALGAEIVTPYADWCVLRSPAGLPFCITPWADESIRPGIVTSPDGAASRLDQFVIDVAPDAYEAETVFWAALTGWESHRSARPEYHVVQQPDELPVRLMVQRLHEARPTSAHHDFACGENRSVIQRWHEQLGATHVADGLLWTVMRDPTGGIYCLTARDPHTGRLA